MQTAKLAKYEVVFDDSVEFHTLKREIWGSHCYYLELPTNTPHILDLGAHIGLASLYFKTIFPNCTIDAYEPSPESFALLKTNLAWNNIKGVSPHNLAVSANEKSLTLHQNQDGTWRSTISIYPGAWNKSQNTTPVVYDATPLRDLIKNRYDLIKMDVEGYEYDLLDSVKQSLVACPNWLVEVHGAKHYDVAALIGFFEKQGFFTRLEKGGKTLKPHQFFGLALLHAWRADAR